MLDCLTVLKHDWANFALNKTVIAVHLKIEQKHVNLKFMSQSFLNNLFLTFGLLHFSHSR